MGRGEYTKEYFIHTMDKRYQILCNRSGGHSVPIIDGEEQAYGLEYCGQMDYTDGKLEIELSGAYPTTKVSSLKRRFTFGSDRIYLADHFVFDTPCGIRERFVTLVRPAVNKGGIKIDKLLFNYDAKAWEASVSEEEHINNSCEKVQIYLLDFVPLSPLPEVFEAEMVIEEE